MKNSLKKCEKCFAYYKNFHSCDGLMKMLVTFYKKKNKKNMNKNTQQILKALSYYGETGITGEKSNPVILNFYAEARNGYVSNDDVPWCAAFVNAILHECGLPQSGRLNARSLLEIGQETDEPVMGDVVVLWRGSKEGAFGHTGFFIREEDDQIFILGGNQDNSVSIKAFPKTRLLGYRTLILE